MQAGINRIVTGYGTQAQPGGWFTFTGSFVSNVVTTMGQKSLTVTADHGFNVEVWGSPPPPLPRAGLNS